MSETFFAELKRYVRFGPEDESALRAFADHAAPHFGRVADLFCERLSEHEAARNVFSGPDQVERLKVSLREWLSLLFTGPWDEAYYERRARIGRVHVRISLPQRYMFGAMDLVRVELVEIMRQAVEDRARYVLVSRALHKIIDIELGIMLETYREAFVDKVQHLERLESATLKDRLALSEARYEEVVEMSEALTVTFASDGRIRLFNRRAEEITGINRAEAVNRTWFDVFCAEADRPMITDRCDRVFAGGRAPAYEGPVVGADGGDRRVRWHFATLPGENEPMLCAIGIDVTEERNLAVRTHRAERLAALGTMAAGLAHEIRNPLNAAQIQLTVAQRRLARAEDDRGATHAALELARGEMKRLAVLVEDFLQFARPQPLRTAAGDLQSTAESVTSLLGPEALSMGVSLVLAPAPSVELVFDDEKMKQVLINLVRNAMEAAGNGGHVAVAVRRGEGQVSVSVEDDGPGFGPDLPVFEPFFTTKDAGTGLGLAIVHRIVADHGGSVDVTSGPGRTVFTVSLPLRARG